MGVCNVIVHWQVAELLYPTCVVSLCICVAVRYQLSDQVQRLQASWLVTRVHPDRGLHAGYGAQAAEVALSVCRRIPGCW